MDSVSGKNGEIFWQEMSVSCEGEIFRQKWRHFPAKSEREFKKRFPGENEDLFLAKSERERERERTDFCFELFYIGF
jgi:hypothetical protein